MLHTLGPGTGLLGYFPCRQGPDQRVSSPSSTRVPISVRRLGPVHVSVPERRQDPVPGPRTTHRDEGRHCDLQDPGTRREPQKDPSTTSCSRAPRGSTVESRRSPWTSSCTPPSYSRRRRQTRRSWRSTRGGRWGLSRIRHPPRSLHRCADPPRTGGRRRPGPTGGLPVRRAPSLRRPTTAPGEGGERRGGDRTPFSVLRTPGGRTRVGGHGTSRSVYSRSP